MKPTTTCPRVVVVDDSASSRASLAEALEQGGCEVVGRAMDGAMALRLVAELKPDVVTCDLEMPRMDGFTFLRLVEKNFPAPVIVVTSDARPEAALQALELGARDFVVKPSSTPAGMRALTPALVSRIFAIVENRNAPEAEVVQPDAIQDALDIAFVVIGSSTGGPPALRDILSEIPEDFEIPIVIAQHMPERFTRAFAERLKRMTGHDIAEAQHDEEVVRRTVRVAPGGFHLEIRPVGGRLHYHLSPASGDERHVPSIDRLFVSAAVAARSRVHAIVLTGMGRDGADGARALARVGASVWAESASTAVINGMPAAAAAAHGNAARYPLDEIGERLSALVRRRASPFARMPNTN